LYYDRRWLRFLIGLLGYYFAGISAYWFFTTEATFSKTLILCFIFFLGFFHGRYAFKSDLTPTQVRLIDYYYLGAGAVGVFLFALTYSSQRAEYVRKFMGAANFAVVELAPARIKQDLKDYVQEACRKKSSPVPHCQTATKISEALGDAPTVTQLRTALEDLSSFLEENKDKGIGDARLFAHARKVLIPLRDVLGWADMIANSKRESDDPLADQLRWLYGEQLSEAFGKDASGLIERQVGWLLGLGQTVLWPMLLAVALALRITKVSIEIFEWAAKPATIVARQPPFTQTS
jgi:hypothetical protein